MADPSFPWLVFGTTPFINATVTIKNTRTNESKSVTTNSDTQYLFDCANFSNGYVNGDGLLITLSAFATIDDLELYVSIDDGNTWQYVTNQINYTTTFNKVRGIVNTGQFPAGRGDNDIVLSA